MAQFALPGQTRPYPSPSPSEDDDAPAEKKPRIDASVDVPTDITDAAPLAENDSLALPQGSKKESKQKRKKKQKHVLPEPYSSEDVLWRDIMSLLGTTAVESALQAQTEWDSPFGFREEVELEVLMLSSNGESLARAPAPHRPWVVVTPFALPGERIRARIYRSSRLHSFADLLSIEKPNFDLRDTSRVRCRYFGKCSGCQYQMLSYESQLDIKRNVVIKAYQNFSNLEASSVPEVLPTIPSPLQYSYRTKITPHFEAPPKKAKRPTEDGQSGQPEWLKIGFNEIGRRVTMDIEECPIATPVLNAALGPIREDIIKNIWDYKKGVSLLLRDSIDTSVVDQPAETASAVDTLATELEKHVCITDHKATVRERVGDMIFEFPGGSFFQNNSSVLVPLTNYVRDAIFPPIADLSLDPPPTHLVDAYCGCGLFSITLSPYFEAVAGIELSSDSIKFATHNARLNNIPEGKCTFRAGDAANIFSVVGDFPPERTVLIIDPPRKGCDEKFIAQLLALRCRTVVYVSCNVHTQARDVGMILQKTAGAEREGGKRYVLESLRAFDLFPQTAHVESVAVLQLK